jgi:hypothetical protein
MIVNIHLFVNGWSIIHSISISLSMQHYLQMLSHHLILCFFSIELIIERFLIGSQENEEYIYSKRLFSLVFELVTKWMINICNKIDDHVIYLINLCFCILANLFSTEYYNIDWSMKTYTWWFSMNQDKKFFPEI